MKRRITLQDIALDLNLTPATVSRALNNHPEISDKTKRMVEETAIRLDYNRNKIASSLRSGKTHVIGVLIPTAEPAFFGSVVHGITNIANSNGYDVIIYQSNESHEYEIKGIKAFISARVDGILASISKDTVDCSHFLHAKRNGIPVVLFDRVNNDLDIPSVTVDDYQGGFLATEHLIEQGYKRIAHVSGPQHIKAFYDRLKGYMGALQANGIKYDPALVFAGDISIEAGKCAAENFLALPAPPDAIFAVEDFAALGVIKKLKERGIRMPKDMGVFGFCNDLFSEHITPGLSTIDQQTILMGQESFKMILNIIDNDDASYQPAKVVLNPVPVIRESSLRAAKV
ncbi:LacI family DNA-binding transcriptional regulator [Pontibacter beigongshangensis]|uniref:LacI family DNA-binding transcriptional regulator n=1 Tax=Pontibacter beigongshangensis TaxID=2574733 RepID=UPI00164F9A68|nr:LacI family DNA-binding transcriptional regulator [Pontibacter beigongshangensis]